MDLAPKAENSGAILGSLRQLSFVTSPLVYFIPSHYPGLDRTRSGIPTYRADGAVLISSLPGSRSKETLTSR
jgi:hypothetical protein